MRKRNHIIPLRLNAGELRHLNELAALSGLAREELLRSLVMGADIRAKPCPHHSNLIHKLAGLCNNANQMARIANTYGTAGKRDVEEMTRTAKEVWRLIKEEW